ncbi:MAG: glucan biosynthesis protein, partial [Rhodanobacteraceae bacterium]
MKRRDFLTATSLALAGLPLLRAGVLRAADVRAATQPFNYAALKGRARAMAERTYSPAPAHIPKAVSKLDWDQFQSIRYLPEHALWADDALRFRLQFFHLGMQFEKSVRLN